MTPSLMAESGPTVPTVLCCGAEAGSATTSVPIQGGRHYTEFTLQRGSAMVGVYNPSFVDGQSATETEFGWGYAFGKGVVSSSTCRHSAEWTAWEGSNSPVAGEGDTVGLLVDCPTKSLVVYVSFLGSIEPVTFKISCCVTVDT